MKWSRDGTIFAVLAFAIVVLWLNLREDDIYAYALEGPPTAAINQSPPAWLPPVDEIAENRLWTRVEDADGWYRLFWMGTDVYYFDDVSYFAGALANRTARNPSGRWTIAGSAGGKPFRVEYRLIEGSPPEGTVDVGPIRVPLGAQWFVRDYSAGRRTFSWVLDRE